MRLVCLFFARSKEITGIPEKEYNVPEGYNTTQFVEILLEDFPALKDILQVSLLSVNLEYLEWGTSVTLHQNDEIAVIPPISGG